MKRWDNKKHIKVEDETVDNFLKDIHKLCKEYGLSISHEDERGGFIITEYDKKLFDWLNDASIYFFEEK